MEQTGKGAGPGFFLRQQGLDAGTEVIQEVQDFFQTVRQQRGDLFLQPDSGSGTGPAGRDPNGEGTSLHQGGEEECAGLRIVRRIYRNALFPAKRGDLAVCFPV